MTSCFVARISNPGERFGKPFYEVDVPSPLTIITSRDEPKAYQPRLSIRLITANAAMPHTVRHDAPRRELRCGASHHNLSARHAELTTDEPKHVC